MLEREFWTYLVSKGTSPTNVTADEKDRNNRARSVAAGVVPGAGDCQPVIEMPHSDESVLSRNQTQTGRSFGKAVKAACARLRVVPDAMHTRKRRRD